jgi:hypothetical protein
MRSQMPFDMRSLLGFSTRSHRSELWVSPGSCPRISANCQFAVIVPSQFDSRGLNQNSGLEGAPAV